MSTLIVDTYRPAPTRISHIVFSNHRNRNAEAIKNGRLVRVRRLITSRDRADPGELAGSVLMALKDSLKAVPAALSNALARPVSGREGASPFDHAAIKVQPGVAQQCTHLLF